MAVAAGVTSNVASGNYTTAQTVTLSTTEPGGAIRYTLDGTAPTATSTLYTAPFVLATGTQTYVKALTVIEGKDNSEILSLYITVTESLLAKVRRSVREASGDAEVDAELTDLIEEARRDMERLGIISSKTTDATDSLIQGAVRCYCRWKWGIATEDSEAAGRDYRLMVDELRRSRDYTGYAITFSVYDDATPAAAVADAYITFNGETKQTGAAGTAVFYYVKAGVNQEYIVEKTGYVTQEVDLDVTATATVSVTLVTA